LRWARSTRRSRPAGYAGQLFTMPFALATLLVLWNPSTWPLLAVAFAIRALAARVVSWGVLQARLNWLLLPLEDIAVFCFWIAGFFGNTIVWRSRTYRLERDGRFTLIS
jgi:ceramide glucosyltransferase